MNTKLNHDAGKLSSKKEPKAKKKINFILKSSQLNSTLYPILISDGNKRSKLTFYSFLRFREESRHMLKLLVDKCICFRAGENPEFPLTIRIGAEPCIQAFCRINVFLFAL